MFVSLVDVVQHIVENGFEVLVYLKCISSAIIMLVVIAVKMLKVFAKKTMTRGVTRTPENL